MKVRLHNGERFWLLTLDGLVEGLCIKRLKIKTYILLPVKFYSDYLSDFDWDSRCNAVEFGRFVIEKCEFEDKIQHIFRPFLWLSLSFF